MSEAFDYGSDRPVRLMRWHPYAELFPLLEGQAFRDLVDDIREHGVREPIVMFEGKVLDGRNRYLAALEAGVEAPLVEYEGDDALGYSISLNLKRRHLTDSQRAVVAKRITEVLRDRDHNDPPIGGVTVVEAAALFSVSVRSVERAGAILNTGEPALIASVEAGDISLGAAEQVARLPPSLQTEIVGAGSDVVREAAAEMRAVSAGPELTREQQAAVRVAAAEGVVARARPRPGHSHSNPSYCADPNFKAMSAVAGAAASIVQRIDAQGPAFIVRGFLDPDMRARNVAGFTAARDALNRLLEACNAH